MQKVLIDTSVWVNHFNEDNKHVMDLALSGQACTHILIIGELSCVSLANREITLQKFKRMPCLCRADDEGVLKMIEMRGLFSKGVGYSDMHLLTSCMLDDAIIWSHDRRLVNLADHLGLSYTPPAD